jgi:hypothetical protein
MNERIKQLEKQCWRSTQSDPYAFFDVKKFAELIVQDLMDSMIKRYGDDDELPIQEIKLFVKEHFGVGE